MSDPYYKLPPDLAEDIDAYERDVQRFTAGDLPAGVLKAKRVPRGVYEQRRDGTYMVRVRVAGGTLTGPQTAELASLATELGNGMLHVTTRQDVQLHDIAIEDTPRVMRRLLGVGLTSKGGGGNTVRNVTACPYAGVCPRECFDVTPLAHAVTEYLIPLVGSYNLPRKYKIAFSGCATDCALAQVADLGFTAEVREGRPGFRVLAGGGMGGHSRLADEIFEWVPVSEVVRIAEAVRRLFDQVGDRSNRHRARLRYAFERLGTGAMRDRLAQHLAAVAREGVPEWHGRAPLNETRTADAPGLPPLEVIAGIRCFPQRQNALVAVPLHLPLGFVPAGNLARIGDAAVRFSASNGLRTTRMQNLLVRDVPRDSVGALADELRDIATDVLGADPLQRFVACAGASTCRLGLCLARDAARACADALGGADVTPRTREALEVYINGCPNACGHQPVGPLGFFGAARRSKGRLVPCYRITLGGHCGADGARLGVGVGQVPARALPAFLAELATDFQDRRRDDESLLEYVERVGRQHVETMVSHHAKIPPYDEQPEYYRDLGGSEDFSLAGRGAGECGAGVFEVIQSDLTAARNAEEPFEVMVPAARALLITRGVDAQDAETVFREFERQFLDTGLVAEEFRPLLSRARGYVQGWQQAFDGHEALVDGLLERVTLLYSTLDANLAFHPPEAGATTTAERSDPASGGSDQVAAAAELDLRGVACPMNFVKAKLKLESMAVDETLTVILDDGEPVRNVPASFRHEGQTVEETTDLGDGHWRVVVRKTG